MSKVTMPEPVAQQIRYLDSTELSRTYGRWSDWQMFTGKYERMGANQKRSLVTTDQAEAYAAAKVREALELAAQTCENQGRATTTLDGESFYIALGQAARAIRALIPPLPDPVEPRKNNE